MEIKLGCEAEDSISGYVGVVVCVSEWLNGCKRLTLQAKGLREGKPIEQQVFDIEQLKVVAVTTEFTPADLVATGGPHDPPTRNADPQREA